MPYTADDLLSAVKLRGAVPAAQGLWQVADFLTIADQEIQSFVLPLVRRVQEEYYTQNEDFAIVPTTGLNQPVGSAYRIPYRAVGGTLRDAYVIDQMGNPIQIPRISLDDLEQASWGLYFMGNALFYINKTTYATPVALRMIYYLRPSRLVLQNGAAQVASVNVAGQTVTLTSVPASYPTGVSATWDLVSGRPGFDMLGFDMTGTLTGNVLSLNGPLPGGLGQGDWLCRPEETPVLQVPAELHPLVAERVAMKFLQAQGDREGAAESAKILQRMEADALTLISQRMGGEGKKIVPRNGLFRRWRR